MRRQIINALDLFAPRFLNWMRFGYHVQLRGWHGEAGLFREVRKRLSDPAAIAVDVGANTGILSRLFSQQYSQVHCIEAVPALAERLKRALPANCIVHNVAAGEDKSRMPLRVPIDASGREMTALATLAVRNSLQARSVSNVKNIEVEVVPLDLILPLSNISFVKIDVEGHELSVIKGCKNILSNQRPVFFIEICRFHNPDFAKTLSLFEQSNYKMYSYTNSKLVPRQEVDIENQINPFSPGAENYFYDFLFVPEKKVADFASLMI